VPENGEQGFTTPSLKLEGVLVLIGNRGYTAALCSP
jgi:hypothetical protein